MSRVRAFTAAAVGAFSLAAFMVGSGYAPPASALGLRGGSNNGAGENQNLLIICEATPRFTSWTASPGHPATATTPAVPPSVILQGTPMLCHGVKADQAALGALVDFDCDGGGCAQNYGYFVQRVANYMPLCTYTDANRGHGNEQCAQLDPDNTGNGGTNLSTSVASGVTCNTNIKISDNDPLHPNGQSTVTYKLFCEQGMDPNKSQLMDDTQPGSAFNTNASYLMWVSNGTYTTPPTWTHCDQGTQPCRVRAGGFPTTTKKGVTVTDNVACQAAFTAQGSLASQQVLLYQETREAECIDGRTPNLSAPATPVNGAMRWCDSGYGPRVLNPAGPDGFDDQYVRCPVTTTR
jgi:hypothetical protein